MEVLVLFPEETYNTCNFPSAPGGGGGGGSGYSDPLPLYGFIIQKSIIH